jgi:hypothetical protein
VNERESDGQVFRLSMMLIRSEGEELKKRRVVFFYKVREG